VTEGAAAEVNATNGRYFSTQMKKNIFIPNLKSHFSFPKQLQERTITLGHENESRVSSSKLTNLSQKWSHMPIALVTRVNFRKIWLFFSHDHAEQNNLVQDREELRFEIFSKTFTLETYFRDFLPVLST
jgi:hypothetical protein